MTALVLVGVVVLVGLARLLANGHRRKEATYRSDVASLAPTADWQARYAPRDGRIWRHEGF